MTTYRKLSGEEVAQLRNSKKEIQNRVRELSKVEYHGEGQDQLAHKLIGDGGFFLDIGCAEPCQKNNSYTLEKLGWDGYCFDRADHSAAFLESRKSKFFHGDVLQINWPQILGDKTVDFISMDIDDGNIELVKKFPFPQYSFKVLCFETDLYQGSDARKKAAEEVLIPLGYVRILENATIKGLAWEDWWVSPQCLVGKPQKNVDYQEFLNNLETW